jgi:DNA-binding NtrC family response regulator
MAVLKVFIIEDNEVYAKALHHHLSLNPDNEVEVFHTGKSFLQALHTRPDMVTLDYSLPDTTGEEILKKIKEFDKEIPVVIVSGQEDIRTAVNLLREGAYDYIVKDENTRERLWNTVNHIRENVRLKDEIDRLREEVNIKYDFSSIKGNSEVLKKVFRLIEKAVMTNITVSIYGETGTGKEQVAKAIHYNSTYRKKPFVAVNMAAIPKDLIESELFGYEKGAFTGANQRRIGKFEEANNSTIFLDEIGELDLHLQAKLLRVLQEKEITRLGSNLPVKVNSRVIVATHRNLAEEVKKGAFREDLYFRLLGLPIELPPLRERGNDIIILAKFFADEFCKDNQLPKVQISRAAQQKMLKYRWPGNVRELKAVMELGVVLSDNGIIEEEQLNFHSQDGIKDLIFEETSLRNYTQQIIKYYLDKYDHNVIKVAEILDVGKSTIYRMIKNKEIVLNAK